MLLDRHVIGKFQILAAATPAPAGGFVAAVEIKALDASPGECLFANYALDGGRLFDDPQEALRHALDVGYAQLMNQ